MDSFFEVALRLDWTGAFVSSDVTDKTHSLTSRNRFDRDPPARRARLHHRPKAEIPTAVAAGRAPSMTAWPQL